MLEGAQTALNRLEELVCDNERAADLAVWIAYNENDTDRPLGWTLDRLQADAKQLRAAFFEWQVLSERGLGDNLSRAVPDLIPDILESFDLLEPPKGVDPIDAKIAVLKASLDSFCARRKNEKPAAGTHHI